MQESINLGAYLWHPVSVTYRDGDLGVGVIQPTSLRNYPFKFASKTSSGERNHSYTEFGQVLMFSKSNEDIVSIERLTSEEKVKNNLNLEQYVGHRVSVTYRDGTQAEGKFNYSGEITEGHWPFLFTFGKGDRDWKKYTDLGRVDPLHQSAKDIMSVRILDPSNQVEKGSATERMALALLPAVFTSLESDPNLEHAIETAIRGTFLSMFGDDVKGETLDHSVSVIKSRISLSVKQ